MMATEQSSTVATDSASFPKWASWLAALVGVWLIASPFVLDGAIAEGTAMWSTAIGGALALLLGAFTGYDIHAAGG